MPKIKTHKASKKRFRLTPRGKIIHWKQGDNGHLRSKKNNRQKSRLSGPKKLTQSSEIIKIKKLITVN